MLIILFNRVLYFEIYETVRLNLIKLIKQVVTYGKKLQKLETFCIAQNSMMRIMVGNRAIRF